MQDSIVAAAQDLHRHGITSIHDQRLHMGRDGPRMLAAYTALHAQGLLPLRVHCNLSSADLEHAIALGLASGLGDEWLRIGHVKFFADGSLGSRTAWMLSPYTPDPDQPGENVGLCVTAPAELRAGFARALHAGLAISVHAIGDRANRTVLDIFEELLPRYPAPAIPHRIEHVQILDPTDTARLRQLNLTASMQPIHALDDIEIAQRYLGQRDETAYALRTLADHNTRLAFGSDAPVARYDPLLGIHAAVQRWRPTQPHAHWFPEQGVDLTTALYAYTLGPAQAVGINHLCGTLEAGKCADFVVLDSDPFALLAEAGADANLAAIRVRATVLAGSPVYGTLD